MAVICPACDAKFRDPPKDVSPNGPFQCGKCEHEWSIETPRMSLDAPALAPEFADLADDEMIKTGLPIVMEGKGQLVKKSDVDAARVSRKLFVDRKPADKAPVKMPLGSMTAMTLVCLMAGGVLFKDAVIAKFPQSSAFYQTAGLVSSHPHLSINNIQTSKLEKDGIRQLIVRGEIRNVADNTVPVPPLKLTMRGKTDANLYAWTVSPVKSSLKAGEKSRFTAVAHNFPGDAVNVEVEFDKPE